MKALVFKKFGGPDVLTYETIPDPIIKEDEVLVRMEAIGLNFADVYRRKGNYHLVGNPPYILGYEGAGVVEAVGNSVQGFKKGDRIAFADVPHANAELVAVPKDKIIPIPDGISFETAASLLLQGLTAHYLTKDSYKIQEGDVVLVHAAAGGVGQLLVQIVNLLGGTVIGLTSSPEKVAKAKELGATSVYLYEENWVEKVKEAYPNGVDVAYDSVGATLMDSFSSVRTGGTVVFYGMAGGDPAPVDPRMLMDTSKTLTGGDLWNILTSHEERVIRSSELFTWVLEEKLRLPAPTVFALRDGQKAHEYLESRKSTGKILLLP
ncbi:quinone oxidoreductase family protein [Priestia koreensis]|uniref:Alcohol dehydrogenase n=1 Tax=Priestia koreensis TaxID=284581 RepID=A0A0M0KWU2_9BACI|nr:quinone oxidoreductase [Priestia koreensis]KOO42858.1 alcohol dehydrogenase [Priestia koreensis]MCM3005389.1 quinone oxidoreductase [Priestia koreensis]